MAKVELVSTVPDGKNNHRVEIIDGVLFPDGTLVVSGSEFAIANRAEGSLLGTTSEGQRVTIDSLKVISPGHPDVQIGKYVQKNNGFDPTVKP